MNNETNNKSFGSGLKGIIEVRKRIDYIVADIFVLFRRPDLRIEALTGYENMTC